MNLSEALKKSSAAAKLIYSYPVRHSSDSSSMPGVGFGLNEDRTAYRLVFHLASEDDYSKVTEVSNQLDVKEPPYIRVVGPTMFYSSALGIRQDRPLQVGSYISRLNQPGGTLGCFVQKKRGSSDLFLLSCTHVLAPYNIGSFGDPIFQPGGSVSLDDKVALLEDFIKLAPKKETSLDAAIAKIICRDTLTYINDNYKSIAIRKHYTRRKFRKLQQKKDVKVFKIGAATNTTSGLVAVDRVSNWMGDDLIVIASEDKSKPFSIGGDSGSLVYDENGRAVGLVVGGCNPDVFPVKDQITYVLPIEPILNQLDVRLLLH